jgi:hypothetical protein
MCLVNMLYSVVNAAKATDTSLSEATFKTAVFGVAIFVSITMITVSAIQKGL